MANGGAQMGDLPKHQHIITRYHQELEDIRSSVLSMGGLVEIQLQEAMRSLEQRDSGLAGKVRERDHRVNAMEVEIDDACKTVLVRRQPTASDLRLVITVIKTITDLERIGDEAKRIATMAIDLAGEEKATRLFTQIYHLGQHVCSMMTGALDAFAHLDTEKAVQVWTEDRSVDREYDALTRELITYMMEDRTSIPCILKAAFIARALERVGDRSSNICEYIIYMVKGKDVRHTRVDDAI